MSYITAIGALITGPVVALVCIFVFAALVIAIIICRVGDAYDKACADLIDATTDDLVEKYRDKA